MAPARSSALVAQEVGTPWILVPPHPGVTAAMGLLATDTAYEYVSTVYQRLSALDAQSLYETFTQLENQARAQLEADGVPADRIIIQRIGECRYAGQGYELRVSLEPGPIDAEWARKAHRAFNEAHQREYHQHDDSFTIEMPNIRVRAIGLMPQLKTAEVAFGDESPAQALRKTSDAWFPVGGKLQQVATGYYDRAQLKAGNRIFGPAIVNQYDSTTVIPPGLVALVDRFGNLIIETGAASVGNH